MPRKGARERIDRNVYKDAGGYDVAATAHGHTEWKRWPLSTAIRILRRDRDDRTTQLRLEHAPTKDTRTLAGAVAAYLLKTQNKRAPEVAALRAWAQVYGHLERRKLTDALCSQQLERWTHEGYSQQSLYYRRLMIEKLWKTLDGPKVKTPVDDLHVSRPKGSRPVWVDDATILEVLRRLKIQEMGGRLRSAKTRARFLVLVTTGQRPVQLKRAQRGDVVIYRQPADGIYGLWMVRAAKGGDPIPVYLNQEQCRAWEAFIVADAWGAYNVRSFARTIHYAGWPKGIRPYNARHATGLTLSEAGQDLRDIQSHMGHTDISTTGTFYVPQLHSRLKELARTLEGRFSGANMPKRPTKQGLDNT